MDRGQLQNLCPVKKKQHINLRKSEKYCQAQPSSLKPKLKLSFSCILNFTPHPHPDKKSLSPSCISS